MFMKRALISLVGVCLAVVSLSAQSVGIPSGAVLYVEPTDFGQALTAAILKKKVPVQVTTNRENASYFLASVTAGQKEGTGERVTKVLVLGAFAGSGKSRDTSVTITNAAGTVLFAYNTKKVSIQSAAEGVAKNLKNQIEHK
jgi:hypothetical protein